MSLLTALLAATALAGTVPCTYGAPAAQPVRPEATARVFVEVRVEPDTPAAAVDATLAPLLEVGLPVTVLVPLGWPAAPDTWQPPAAGVDLGMLTTLDGLVGRPVADPSAMSFIDWRDALRSGRRSVQKSVGQRPKVVAMPPPPPMGEVAIDDAGFTALLLIDPGDAAVPRRSVAFGGRTGRTRVLTEGTPADPCGALLGTPVRAALDRVARVGPSQVVTRVALPPDPATARALALWWSTTAAPADWKAWSVQAAFLRLGNAQLAPKPTTAAPAATVTVELGRLTAAAPTLTAARRLPRVLPGDLNLTTAFAAFTAATADPTQPAYALAPLGPPPDVARTTLTDPIELAESDLRAAARSLLPGLTGTVPTVVEVGGHSLTNAEFLVAMAALLQGATPIARPVGHPDPYAVGAGWGALRLD